MLRKTRFRIAALLLPDRFLTCGVIKEVSKSALILFYQAFPGATWLNTLSFLFRGL
jgi:hypothetical protein